MTPHSDVEALRLVACSLGLPLNEREQFISSKCKGRDDLRERVEQLICATDEDQSLPLFELQRLRDIGDSEKGTPARSVSSDVHSEVPVGALVSKIGPYRIIKEIGRGGMGLVYLAEQVKPKRQVALKVIRPSYRASKGVSVRFDREIELLGRLEHPGIARIYEAGSTGIEDVQVKYIAIEYVQGLDLADYIATVQPTLNARLVLIQQIAEAVHHAHQRGVIHRDLKPSNIRVLEKGQPKILDFGIAASTTLEGEAIEQTLSGEVLGTLAYMSPEQAQGRKRQIDSRSDIYSLGLIAYEILLGEPAFSQVATPLERVVNSLDRAEPPLLGKRKPRLAGDIDAIIGKACRFEPSARYASAMALANDIENHLSHRPIEARPPSVLYELKKFVKRRKGLVVAANLVVIALISGLIVSWIALKRAQDESLRHEKIVQLQTGLWSSLELHAMGLVMETSILDSLMLKASAEHLSTSQLANIHELVRQVSFADIARDVLYSQVFEPAVEKVNADFAEQPLDRAALLQALADILRLLGFHREAGTPQTMAYEIRLENKAPPGEIWLSETQLGWLLLERGMLGKARICIERACDRSQKLHEHGSIESIKSMLLLARLLSEEGWMSKAVQLAEQSYGSALDGFGQEEEISLFAQTHLGEILWKSARHFAALRVFARLLGVRERQNGGKPLSQLTIHDRPFIDAMENEAKARWSLNIEGDRKKVVGDLEAVLEIRMRVFGASSPDTWHAKARLIVAQLDLLRDVDEQDPGAFRQKYQELSAVYDFLRAHYGEEHLLSIEMMTQLARFRRVLVRRFGNEQVIDLPYGNAQERAIELASRFYSKEHRITIDAMAGKVVDLFDRGLDRDAFDYGREVLECLRARPQASNKWYDWLTRRLSRYAYELCHKPESTQEGYKLQLILVEEHLSEESPVEAYSPDAWLYLLKTQKRLGRYEGDYHERAQVLRLSRLRGSRSNYCYYAAIALELVEKLEELGRHDEAVCLAHEVLEGVKAYKLIEPRHGEVEFYKGLMERLRAATLR